jgi:transcriptional regulatory protein RtcR
MRGRGGARWDRWRPTVALTQHEDLVVDRLELLLGRESRELAAIVTADIRHASPETRVVEHIVDFKDAWDFERVYGTLLDFAKGYPFDPETEDYLVHITAGTRRSPWGGGSRRRW